MRLTRYKVNSHFDQFISDIKGKKANIVFRDGRVTFGWILDINSKEMLIKNMRLNRSKIELKLINEIIIDSKA